MKTRLLLLILTLSSMTFAQVNWFSTEAIEAKIPMSSAGQDIDYTENKIEYPVNIKYYTMVHDNTVYFNWAIKANKQCIFLVEQSDDGEHFEVVDFMKNTPCSVELWYGVKIPDVNKRFYRVVQVFNNDVRLDYPTKAVSSSYEFVSYKRTSGQRTWINF